jgi:hypothetical protein
VSAPLLPLVSKRKGASFKGGKHKRRSSGGGSKRGKVVRGAHGGGDVSTTTAAAALLWPKVEGDPMVRNGPQGRKMLGLKGQMV